MPSGTSWTPACAVRPNLPTRRLFRMPRPATGRVPRLTLVLLFVSLLLQSPPSPAAAPPAPLTVATGVSPEATAENSQRKLVVDPAGLPQVVGGEYAPGGRIPRALPRGGLGTKPAGLSTPGVYAGIPVVAPRG